MKKEEISPLTLMDKNKASVFQDIKGWHVAIRTDQYNEFINWYSENLDFRLIREWSAGNLQLAFMAPPGEDNFIIEVLGEQKTVDQNRLGTGPGYDHLCFNVQDLDRTMEALTKRNIGIDRCFDVPAIGKRVAFITDPFGNRIEFSEEMKNS